MEKLQNRIDNVLKNKNNNSILYATKDFPENYELIYSKTKKAFETSYTPYPYQKQASVVIDSIYGLHNNCPNSNLLIASPTGSGKTFAIKWAAHRAIETGRKLIIAVPLVALAEQIYFELRKLLSDKEIEIEPDHSIYADDFDYYDDYYDEQYSHEINSYISNINSNQDEDSLVGIRTGPSEKYPDAPILVCTYEVVLIQMNQNYRFMENCPLLIIDEIHMISDQSRGHIPENIMNHPNMPYGTRIIGLSGTLPNSEDLAEFIGRTNQTETRIIGAKKRPISLDYFIHTGETITDIKIRKKKERKRKNKEEGNISDSNTDDDLSTEEDNEKFHKVYNSEEKIFNDEKWEEINSHKVNEYMNSNQMKTKMLGLIEDLRKSNKMPAMIVGFSCKKLNRLSTYLDSINLCENKKCSSMVHIEFNRLKNRVPKEEWCLFEKFKELGKRGIGVHHSQNPKHYLEILPKLVKKGYIKLVFATSSLSAGIDLPVRTVVITDVKMPTQNGFQPIETNLFHQICGRAGRPGLETQGNVVITQWKKQEVNIQKMITTPPVPVVSKFKLTPSIILNILSKDDPDGTVSKLVLGSFSTKNTNHIASLLVQGFALIKKETTDEIKPLIEALQLLNTIRNDAEIFVSSVWKEMKKLFKINSIIYVDPEYGSIQPVKTIVRKVSGDILETDHGTVKKSWVFYIENSKFKKIDFKIFEIYKKLRENIQNLITNTLEYTEEQYKKASELIKFKSYLKSIKNGISPETSFLWEEYQTHLDILKNNNFITENETPTLKGKMAAGVLSTEDPLTLIEILTRNEYSEEDVIPTLTSFLRKKRHNEPAGNKLYQKAVNIQKDIWKLKNETLGTSMIYPMQLWFAGHPVSYIVQNCDISVGHFCKEALRMKELISQLINTSNLVGNTELETLFQKKNEQLQRGLPFIQSTFLK